MKDTLCYEFSIYSFSTQLRATTCSSLQLEEFSSSHTNGIATSTCANLFSDSPSCQHSLYLLSGLTQAAIKKEGYFISQNPDSHIIFFPILNFPHFLVPAQLSILIISNKKVIWDMCSTKLPKPKVITALRSFTF